MLYILERYITKNWKLIFLHHQSCRDLRKNYSKADNKQRRDTGYSNHIVLCLKLITLFYSSIDYLISKKRWPQGGYSELQEKMRQKVLEARDAVSPIYQ